MNEVKKIKIPRKTRVYRVAAWANIVTQLLFPVAASLTPVWVTAAPVTRQAGTTTPYTLKPGETTDLVAARLGLTAGQPPGESVPYLFQTI
ncbi:hypothetical protein [Morganella sp. EGD-HP17]|uniref:hypothetical protein n=1 Tax=Morganella sp. EGD-HP17 TaxID=1435146 RepID=UPI0012E1B47D|nr:hypothetical protein [Morganella sp. EGD-HP17]